jgi:hypothetical protein
MSNSLWNVFKVTPALVSASLLMSNSAFAIDNNTNELLNQVNTYSQEMGGDSLNQVNSVDQLRDVSPGDWAYDALKSLVENYNCIAGYPNGTYRGNRSLSRYEFAAGLNACLESIQRLIASNQSVVQNDLDTIKKLVEQFQAELTALGSRVDNLEGRTKFLEDHQFSTTTKLRGEVIFAAVGAFGNERANDSLGQGPEIDENITLNYRTRLNFDTSFMGKDRLRVRLQAANFTSLDNATGTVMSRLGFDQNTSNNVQIDDLHYRFPLGKQTTVFVGTNSLDLDNVFDVVNPYFESSGTGALSRFGRRNPLVYRGSEGAGAGFKYKFNDTFNLSATYLADGGTASDPSPERGLFDGAYSAGAQLGFTPNKNLSLALTYVHSYQPSDRVNLTGSTGSVKGRRPFGTIDTSSDRFGFQANYSLSSKFNIGAWVGYAMASDNRDTGADLQAEYLTWAVSLAFPDLGKEGNVGGIIVGMPPKLIEYSENDVNIPSREDPDTTIHIEALYKYKVSDNIMITPGVIVLLNPNHNENNDTIYVGTIRTTFSF